MQKTKTYLYLFKVFKTAYLSSKQRSAINKLHRRARENVDDLNVYLLDKNYPNAKIDDRIMYVMVDTRNPRFEAAMHIIKDCSYFKGVYQAYNINSHKAILRFLHPVTRQWDTLLDSKYSKIYRRDDGSVFLINDNDIVRSEYLVADPTTGEYKFSKEWHVMMRTQSYFEKNILPLTENLPKNEVEEIKNREYDDMLNLSKEIIDTSKSYEND